MRICQMLGVLAAVLLSMQVEAEVWRCSDQNGHTVYQDTPCLGMAPGDSPPDKNAESQSTPSPGQGSRCLAEDGEWYPYNDSRCVGRYKCADARGISRRQDTPCPTPQLASVGEEPSGNQVDAGGVGGVSQGGYYGGYPRHSYRSSHSYGSSSGHSSGSGSLLRSFGRAFRRR